MWVDEPAGANLIEAQLNTYQLRDDQNQKTGILLGQNVSFNKTTGTGIGDTSGSLTTTKENAQELCTAGGNVLIKAEGGDIIAKQGSNVYFSGGGYQYDSGAYETTKLVSGNTVTDISNANDNVTYTNILGNYEEIFSRFGITEKFDGIYYGGANPVNDYCSGFIQGSSAGSLKLDSSQIAFEGKMDGAALSGVYQVNTSNPLNGSGSLLKASDPQDAETLIKALGVQQAGGGSLILGEQLSSVTTPSTIYGQDSSLGDVVIGSSVSALPTNFGLNTPYPIDRNGVSYISPDMLNNASLQSLTINSNTRVTIEKGADIELQAGGELYINSRQIESHGDVTIPSGSVTLTLEENSTYPQYLQDGTTPNPAYRNIDQHILIDGIIDVSGQEVDNSKSSQPLSAVDFTGGGSVTLKDTTLQGSGVMIAKDGVVDVSGGYAISPSGTITGADAGTLSIQGSSISLEGDIRGYSLPGNNGGALKLITSKDVYIDKSDSPLPATINQKNTVVLADNRLTDTGFDQITLESVNNLTIGKGATLSPSFVKEIDPVSKVGSANIDNYSSMEASSPQDLKNQGLFIVDADYLGKSTITLNSDITIGNGGEYSCGLYGDGNLSLNPNINAKLNLSENSAIKAAPSGTINLNAPGIDIAGDIIAPGGTINATATQPGGITIFSGSTISAAGYNKPNLQSQATGLSTGFTPVNGGQINLTSSSTEGGGDILINKGAVIDVSGSLPTTCTLSGSDGLIYSEDIASAPGAVSLSFSGLLVNTGLIKAEAGLAGLTGGTLNLSNTATPDNEAAGLTVTSGDIDSYLAYGFDSLSFKSNISIDFQGSINKKIGRSLTLDAPIIDSQTDNQMISLSAPYVTVSNSTYPSTTALETGTSLLALTGDYINVTGDIRLQGFNDVNLIANHDIMLTDYKYTDPATNNPSYDGSLQVPGNLTLGADRIYPTTLTDFTILAKNGTLTTKPGQGNTQGPILSAGGSLTIDAENIDHTGSLYAPMGTISLISDAQTDPDTGKTSGGRTYLETGSIISTSGQASVNYGELGATEWTITDKANPNGTALQVTGAPASSVSIKGDQDVIVKQGATIDTSGGGSISSYSFVAGNSGSIDPLTQSGLYIVVPGLINIPGMSQPGQALTISGSGGLTSGTYTLFPANTYGYLAFMPGAYILSYQGTNTSFQKNTVSSDGYPLVYGYTTLPGTNIKSFLENVYSVRSASVILSEAGYSTAKFVAGDAGTISLAAPTMVLNGTVSAQALNTSYNGGTISLSGNDIEVVNSGAALPGSFTFSDPVPSNLNGKCVISAIGLNNTGVSELNIGALYDSQGNLLTQDMQTKTIDLQEGVSLSANKVMLSAADSITLETGVNIDASGIGGTTSLMSPEGKVVVGDNSLIHATNEVDINTQGLDLNGMIKTDSGTLNLTSNRIIIAADSYQGDKTDGLYLTDQLTGFEGFDNVSLKGTQGLIFKGDINLNVVKELDIDSPLISHEHQGIVADNVSVNAGTLSIMNSSGSTISDTSQTDTAGLTISADQISIGHGNINLEGFGSVDIQSKNDLTFMGKGSLYIDGNNALANGAAVNISASRVTTDYFMNGSDLGAYEVPDFAIDAGTRTLNVKSSGSTPGTDETPGGTLAITAGSIDNAGIIDVPSGIVKLTATTGDLTLENGSQILAKGTKQTLDFGTTVYSDGGAVELTADAGGFTGNSGSVIDVSALESGDAGKITISTPNGRAVLNTTLNGQATGGHGGSFNLDAGSINSNGNGADADLGSLAAKMTQGGFNESISIRDHTDNLHLGDGDNLETLKAGTVVLTADTGTVTIGENGTIDASGTTGGNVEVNAGSDLNLSGVINNSSTGAGQNGGEVLLSSDHGQIRFTQEGVIDVSSAAGSGGSVYFSAQRTGTGAGNDVAMDLQGKVNGAAMVAAEAFKKYPYMNPDGTTILTDLSQQGTLYTDTSSFMSNYAKLYSHLESMSCGNASFLVMPGIEVDSNSGITLTGLWDLSSWRFQNQSGNLTEPGMLTLRTGGDLTIVKNLVHHPTSSINALNKKSPLQDSWGFTLVAGADTSSADVMAVKPNTGNLIIGSSVVYTEGAPLRFASGGDTVMTSPLAKGYMINSTMAYNIGTFDGSIQGKVGGDLNLGGGGIIQSAAGNIDIDVAGDLPLGQFGAIRTTGYNIKSQSASSYGDYGGGGNITLDVKGDVSGQINIPNSWDTLQNGIFTANYADSNPRAVTKQYSTRGISTMGGGDLTIHTGGDFLAQAGTFGPNGTSDLKIVSNGDINGRFLVEDGLCELTAKGNFGTNQGTGTQNQIIEAFDTDVRLTAQGDIELGSVVNPTLADPSINSKMNCTYDLGTNGTSGTSVQITSLKGSVTITGEAGPYGNTSTNEIDYFPGTLEIAAGKDINLESPEIIMAPSPEGNLTLQAGRDISGYYVDSNGVSAQSGIYMLDTYYDGSEGYDSWLYDAVGQNLAHDLIHLADTTPINVQAGNNIHDLQVYLPKEALIGAGNDIHDVLINGQNLKNTDVSYIWAGNNIMLTTENDPIENIEYNGPGNLIVQAGNTLDLGTSTNGIQSLGNQIYSNLSDQGCNLIVAAGIERNLNPTTEGTEEVAQFFSQIKSAGVTYTSELTSKPQEALDDVSKVRTDVIEQFIGMMGSSSENNGGVNMTSSQITTAQGGDIDIISGGSVNVGLSGLQLSGSSNSNTGITTQYGGNINIFAEDDVNVLASRVMTLHGGDILIWSDQGNINAGRGSTTAVSRGDRKPVTTPEGTIWIYPPTAVGSGIRTVTYAIDELHPAPEAGSAYIFAPSGTIDAGEAGIAANNLYIGALKVLNTQNIQVTGVSVGAPITNTGTGSLTALSGTGTLSSTTNLSEEMAGISSSATKAGTATEEAYVPQWVKVMVIGFGDDGDLQDNDDQTKAKAKKKNQDK